MATAPSSQARLSFQEAFERLRRSVSTDDARDFQSTDLQHVREAARDIERQLAARQCLRNLRRIQPLFDGLERYSKTVEILCNGTPYLPWIWVRYPFELDTPKANGRHVLGAREAHAAGTPTYAIQNHSSVLSPCSCGCLLDWPISNAIPVSIGLQHRVREAYHSV